MAARAVVFDIGGVLEVPTDTDLDGRWERRLGLRPGEFFQRLRRSGLGRPTWAGAQRPSSRRRWPGCTGWMSPQLDELLAECGTGMWAS